MTAHVSLPHTRIPFVDLDGRLTEQAYQFLYFMWQRTGGHTDIISDLSEENEEIVIDGRVGELQKSLNDLAYDVEQISDNRSFIEEVNKNLLKFKIFSVTAATTAQVDSVYLCDGTFNITLPAVSLSNEKQLHIKNIGTGIITMKGNGFELIEDTNEQELTVQYDSVLLVCNKVKWFVL